MSCIQRKRWQRRNATISPQICDDTEITKEIKDEVESIATIIAEEKGTNIKNAAVIEENSIIEETGEVYVTIPTKQPSTWSKNKKKRTYENDI